MTTREKHPLRPERCRICKTEGHRRLLMTRRPGGARTGKPSRMVWACLECHEIHAKKGASK